MNQLQVRESTERCCMSEPRFTPTDVDRAIGYVIEHGTISSSQRISYAAVLLAGGLEPPLDLVDGRESLLVTAFMLAFHERCINRSLPPLDALIVHVTGRREGYPGSGYFLVNNQPDPFFGGGDPQAVIDAIEFWDGQRDRVRRWGDAYRRVRTRDCR